MSDEAFTVSVVDAGDDVLVVVTGALDAATCPELRAAFASIAPPATRDVVVDLAGIDFLDSTALDLLTDVSLELLADGRRLIVAEPSPAVVRLMSITDLLTWFVPRE